MSLPRSKYRTASRTEYSAELSDKADAISCRSRRNSDMAAYMSAMNVRILASSTGMSLALRPGPERLRAGPWTFDASINPASVAILAPGCRLGRFRACFKLRSSVSRRKTARSPIPTKRSSRPERFSSCRIRCLRHLHRSHQLLDLLLALVPRSVRIVVKGVDKLGTSVKALILSMPAGKVRAEIIPRELHELQAVDRGRFTRGPVTLEGLAQRGVAQRAHVGRHLERPRPQQFPDGFGDQIVVVGAPIQGGVELPSVDVDVWAECFSVLDLTRDPSLHSRLCHRNFRERFTHGWDL